VTQPPHELDRGAPAIQRGAGEDDEDSQLVQILFLKCSKTSFIVPSMGEKRTPAAFPRIEVRLALADRLVPVMWPVNSFM
jgi:hypothetical protein